MYSQKWHIGAFFLALLIFGSAGGVFVNKHFCREELKSIAFFQKAESCHAAETVCPMHAKETKKNCCDNESDYVKLELDQELTQQSSLTLEMPVFCNALPFAQVKTCTELPGSIRIDRNKAPPPWRSHSIFTQSFLL